MSKNCMRCIVNERTGPDLLCDDCRARRNALPRPGPARTQPAGSWKIDTTPGDLRIIDDTGETVFRGRDIELTLTHFAFALQRLRELAAPPPPQPTAADAGGHGERRWAILHPDGTLEHVFDARHDYAFACTWLGDRIACARRVVPVRVTVIPADGDPAAAGADGRDVANDLHQRAMNVRARPESLGGGYSRVQEVAYKIGHRDARHDIAEIIVGHEGLRRLGERLAAAERDRDGLRRTVELQSREIDEPPFLADPGTAGADLPIATGSDAERAAKLQKFKDWVHNYLDAHGVPHHPPGSHGAAGCRIGDRMDWLMARLAAAERERDAAESRAEDIATACVNQALEIEALRHERDGLRAALEWYADEGNYNWSGALMGVPAARDNGERARQALAPDGGRGADREG